ncbi:SDR family oxidoreductase [Actinophytocola sp.]|uniref:SDR family oxidoreductase n=1 Tax=Actinophytocola sp. TaxID=1872138 RepID=UPI002ED4155D
MSVATPSLHGTTVVVIGGSSGMGKGVARSAAALGASVVVTSRSADRLDDAVKQVTDGIPDAVPPRAFVCDLTDDESVNALFGQLERLDHLVITATPGSGGGAFLDTDVEDARGVVDGKLWGSWRAARAGARLMIDGPGASPAERSILFNTGGMAVRPVAGRATISVAFAAVEALTRALAVELAPLRVNALRPGLTDTEMWSSVPDADREAIFSEFARTAPARRVGTPADQGGAATFLMTAPFVTGAVLDVDGGILLI